MGRDDKVTRGERWSARWNGWRDARRGLPGGDDRLRFGYARKLRGEAERVRWELLGRCSAARAAMVASAYRVLLAGAAPMVPAQRGTVPLAVPMSREAGARAERRRRDADRQDFLRALSAWERLGEEQRARARAELRRIEERLELYLAALTGTREGTGLAGAVPPIPEWSQELPPHEAEIVNRALALLSLGPLRPPRIPAESRRRPRWHGRRQDGVRYRQ